jgi:hypothetical protein
MSTQDFWGDIGPAQIRTPASILREQASLLGEKTHNLIEGKVATSNNGAFFFQTMFLVAPALNNYHYELLKVRHEIQLYPVVDVTNPGKPLKSEAEFVDWLRAKLSSLETRRIIEALLAQTTGS